MVSTTAFDVADYLDSPEMIAAYLDEAFASEDPALIDKALATVRRAPEQLKTMPAEMLKRITELTEGKVFGPDEDIEGDVNS
ncbi:transcriptional regulator [Rhodopseudomonas palustris]|uniref:Transcriptional regulator n=1 Tax=Rhodopseudomonas palustris TaxID=1076 RepID=A0AAX3DWY6_RHOPL|nr:transcriptional regulator [Rhodopseudomonas palustris]UYO39243.1 transcriptional regulator [Rhodopseudomonas palustris]UYO43965.1 transcriptional regulator [Rhodopseudomonas palustris]